MMNVTDGGTQVGLLRLAQYSGLSEPGVFMAVAFDLNDNASPYGAVHPRDKQVRNLR
jgi:hypothetical protein